ncbi:MAG: ParB/RepB/Spo0J family partition protein [Patescibacteria group bacterium]|nr:ParB/RepB/Spo0J family partition protein [Patescibacteria group bacterium]
MLGKGLESLIPQKGNNNSGGNDDQNGRDNGPVSEPQNVNPAASNLPVDKSVQDVDDGTHPENGGWRMENGAQKPETNNRQPETGNQKPGARNSYTEQPTGSIFHIEVDKIAPNPDQPRRHFDETALQDLARSIREFGFLQPLVVTKIEKETPTGVDVEYQLIAGERRLLAAKLLGLRLVPAIIRNVQLEREKLELAVIENIQRENLNPIETARAFQRLQEEFRMTQREIAAKLGKSREVVANTVRLLDLPEYIQQAVQKGDLSESHARLLLSIGDPGAQRKLFEDVVANRLTTRDVKERVKEIVRPRAQHLFDGLSPELKEIQESLSSSLGAPVEIHKGANTGKITIAFYSEEELENILQRLRNQDGAGSGEAGGDRE